MDMSNGCVFAVGLLMSVTFSTFRCYGFVGIRVVVDWLRICYTARWTTNPQQIEVMESGPNSASMLSNNCIRNKCIRKTACTFTRYDDMNSDAECRR